MENYRDTLLSQYANSPTITAMIELFNDCIDPSVDLDTFFNVVWNVDTAQGFGLDIWGRIVNVSRELQISTNPDYMGFYEARTYSTRSSLVMDFANGYYGTQSVASANSSVATTSGAQPFGQAPMYNGPLATSTFTLADDAYRKLIMVKALGNITDCTAPSINKLLTYLFDGRGRCYVQDTGSMQIRYVFEFTLTDVELAIMISSKAIPRSAGVLVSVLQFDLSSTFGFAEGGLQPFGQGTFFTKSGLQDAN